MNLYRTRFISEPSYAIAENLIFGRMAFKGMNPEIEKMMEEQRLREQEAADAEGEKDVQDEEMAAAYHGNVVGTVGRKFAAKRKRGEDDANSSQVSSSGGEDLIQRGHRMVEDLRAASQNLKWENPMFAAAASGGGQNGGGKRKKFLKPATD